MPEEQWRAEADDEWLAERQSDVMGWIRRRFRVFGGVGGAVSNAEMGPYAGAPRNPELRIDDKKSYSTILYTSQQVPTSTISVQADRCPHCGRPLIDDPDVPAVGAAGPPCGCQTGSWQRTSHMPNTERARDSSRKHVV